MIDSLPACRSFRLHAKETLRRQDRDKGSKQQCRPTPPIHYRIVGLAMKDRNPAGLKAQPIPHGN